MISKQELQLTQKKLLEILKEIILFCENNQIKYCLAGGSMLGAVRNGGIIPWDDDIDIYIQRKDLNKFIELWIPGKYSIITKYDSNYCTVSSPIKIHDKSIKINEIDESHFSDMKWNEYGLYVDIFPIDGYRDKVSHMLINRYYGKLKYVKRLAKNGIKKKGIKKVVFFLVNLINEKLFTKIDLIIETKIVNNHNSMITGFGYDVTFSNLWLKNYDMFDTKKVDFDGLKVCIPKRYKEYLEHRFGNYKIIPPITERKTHLKKIKFND